MQTASYCRVSLPGQRQRVNCGVKLPAVSVETCRIALSACAHLRLQMSSSHYL